MACGLIEFLRRGLFLLLLLSFLGFGCDGTSMAVSLVPFGGVVARLESIMLAVAIFHGVVSPLEDGHPWKSGFLVRR